MPKFDNRKKIDFFKTIIDFWKKNEINIHILNNKSVVLNNTVQQTLAMYAFSAIGSPAFTG